MLVLSHDVIAEDSSGATLLRYLIGTKSLASLIILAPKEKAGAFADSIDLHGLEPIVISPDGGLAPGTLDTGDTVAIEHRLHSLLDRLPGNKVITHGLLAHCLVSSAAAVAGREWLLIGAKEFDVILGHPPKDPGVSIAALRRAIAKSSVIRHLGKIRPHALARIAQVSSRPIDEFRLDEPSMLPGKSDGGAPAIRIVGIGPHATAGEWHEVARALRSLEVSLACRIGLRLLAWGPFVENLCDLAMDGDDIEIVSLYDRPNSLAPIGDVLIAPDPTLQAHGPELEFELYGSSMRIFGFASVVSASRDRSKSEFRTHLTTLLERS